MFLASSMVSSITCQILFANGRHIRLNCNFPVNRVASYYVGAEQKNSACLARTENDEMSDSTLQENLELEVADFGPIVEGHIALRPLTVFVGPSNTGKSYLAILIYALHKIFSGGDSRAHWRFPPIYGSLPSRLKKKTTMKALADMAEQMFQEDDQHSTQDKLALPSPIAELMRLRLGDQAVHIGGEISRCFGAEKIGALIRKGTSSCAHIVLRKTSIHDAASANHELTIKAHRTEFKAAIPDGMYIRFDKKKKRDGNLLFELRHLFRGKANAGQATQWTGRATWEASRIIGSLTDLAVPHVFGPLHLPAFYLPADRTGVMHAHNVVVSALIENASMAGLRPAARTPMLSGVLADFLEQLIQIDGPPYRRRTSRSDPGRKIEEAILGGTVQVERSEVIGYPHFTYRPNKWKNGLSLMNASSMVSELAPVVLYLRHLVRSGSVLIIEEPESHLHPAMQVEFIRQLAAIVQMGIRVIVTTHSDWVLDELANIVRRSALPKAERIGESLRPNEVGAWLFKPKLRPKGSVLEEIKLDEETGLYPTDYDTVSEALYNENVSIFNRMQDRKTE